MSTKAQRERGPGSAFHKERTEYGVFMSMPDGIGWAEEDNLPDPMPARDAKGKRIWLHYRPLRWERHP